MVLGLAFCKFLRRKNPCGSACKQERDQTGPDARETAREADGARETGLPSGEEGGRRIVKGPKADHVSVPSVRGRRRVVAPSAFRPLLWAGLTGGIRVAPTRLRNWGLVFEVREDDGGQRGSHSQGQPGARGPCQTEGKALVPPWPLWSTWGKHPSREKKESPSQSWPVPLTAGFWASVSPPVNRGSRRSALYIP